jgi:three-Cys-motif partner protein
MKDTNKKYWEDYDGLQHAKHQLLKNYLGGWFPILSRYKGRVIYIDSHAGRGRHLTGDDGSPILALKLLLNHRIRDQILLSTEVRFMFFENNLENYNYLRNEIASLGTLPPKMIVDCYDKDYEVELRAAIKDIRTRNKRPAPIFAFIDPFGFTLPMDLLNELLAFPSCELLINFMYRYVDLAIHQDDLADKMDALFGSSAWRSLVNTIDSDDRAESTIQLFSKQLNAKYVTHMKMRAVNGTLKYVLIHASNHEKGRKLMKGAMWSITPDGSFTASERYSPHQYVLLTPTPDLKPLEESLWNSFAGKKVSMDELYSWLVNEIYNESHLNDVLRDYRKKGIITASGYTGRFAFSHNPIITFPPSRPH